MKYLKYILFLLAVYVMLPCSVFAQGSNNAVASVNISIVKSLKINKIEGDLLFDDIALTGSSTKIIRTPDKGVLFEVNGNPGRDVTFDFKNVLLNNSSDDNQLRFTPKVAQTQSNTNFVSPQKVINGSSHKLEDVNGTGYLYLWVGGEIDLDRNLSSGNYSGEFLVSVSYWFIVRRSIKPIKCNCRWTPIFPMCNVRSH